MINSFMRAVSSPHIFVKFSRDYVNLYLIARRTIGGGSVLRLQWGQVRGDLWGHLVATHPPKGLPRRRVEDGVLKDHRSQPQPQLHVSSNRGNVFPSLFFLSFFPFFSMWEYGRPASMPLQRLGEAGDTSMLERQMKRFSPSIRWFVNKTRTYISCVNYQILDEKTLPPRNDFFSLWPLAKKK